MQKLKESSNNVFKKWTGSHSSTKWRAEKSTTLTNANTQNFRDAERKRKQDLLLSLGKKYGIEVIQHIFTSQQFRSLVAEECRIKILNCEFSEEIYKMCGEIMAAIDDTKLKLKMINAMKPKYTEESKEVIELKEILDEYCNTTSSNESTEIKKKENTHKSNAIASHGHQMMQEAGDCLAPRKAIEREPCQAKADTRDPDDYGIGKQEKKIEANVSDIDISHDIGRQEKASDAYPNVNDDIGRVKIAENSSFDNGSIKIPANESEVRKSGKDEDEGGGRKEESQSDVHFDSKAGNVEEKAGRQQHDAMPTAYKPHFNGTRWSKLPSKLWCKETNDESESSQQPCSSIPDPVPFTSQNTDPNVDKVFM